MANYTQNGITFTNVKAHGKIEGAAPVGTGQNGVDEFGGIINAIDIDWNDAILPNASTDTGGQITINTTGELLDLINKMQEEIYVLTAAVIALSQN